ncbi:fibrinogen C domain-containing protein 1-like [Gigantopelta aegis]|uniref:fibrinogen C domain-containing protein 1-like n=1 Tax=Gigantopelta aegis TaxID=1735272 RepID=UPI001B88D028|nr:fibrinogen C domain-containing protein 1-like [Gigantopelta aegis]
MECAMKCYDNCEGFFFNIHNGLCSLYNQRFVSMTFVNNNGTQAYEDVSRLLPDCYDVMMKGGKTNRVYTIQPRDAGGPINVWCEISDNQGWLVFQRRTDGSVNFDRTWNEYRDGFGDLNNEFWLGNTNIHRITRQGHYDLTIDLEDFEGNTKYALYKNFSVASEQDYFRLSLGEYSGNAGDSFHKHSGYNFTTKDRDLDTHPDNNCAVRFSGGWWYNRCHSANLNGLYLNGSQSSYADGVNWKAWRGLHYSLKRTTMKIRPMEFKNNQGD